MTVKRITAMLPYLVLTPYQTKIFKIYIIVALVVLCGCLPFKKAKQNKESAQFDKFQKQTDVLLSIEEPKQLITNFRDMKETETVAWAWVDPGFQISDCRSIEIAPVQNFSMYKYPWAEQRIQKGLKKIFNTAGNRGTGTIDAEITAAIIDMKPRKKLMSRITPFEEDYVNIEMQMVIVDKSSKSLLCKITDGKRTENFEGTVDGMLKDVEQFFFKDVQLPHTNHGKQ